MKPGTTTQQADIRAGTRTLRVLYLFTFAVLAFTGFGQMPIFKRYGIADLPGMAWSADFYTTHTIHYLGAILLLALISYAMVDFALRGRKSARLTTAAFVQTGLLACIVATGILRVLKNLPDVVFSPGFTFFIDLAHLGFMIIYLLTALIFLLTGKRWLRPRTP